MDEADGTSLTLPWEEGERRISGDGLSAKLIKILVSVTGEHSEPESAMSPRRAPKRKAGWTTGKHVEIANVRYSDNRVVIQSRC